MNYRDLTLQQFTQALYDPTPTPGGGGAAALSASIGIALGGMVASLTAINKKYAHCSDEMHDLFMQCKALSDRFLALIDEDARAYEPLSLAYKLPRDTEEQIAFRSRTIQENLVGACQTPIEIMKCCCDAIDILEKLCEKGSTMLISDVGAGLILMRCALNTASINVYINIRSLKDIDKKNSIKTETDNLLNKYTILADKLYNEVISKIN